MKKIYKSQGYSSFNGGEWYELGQSSKLLYLEESESENYKLYSFDNFDEAHGYLKSHKLCCAYRDFTLFRNKPMVCYKNYYGTHEYHPMSRSTFKPFIEKWKYIEVDWYSIRDLMESMHAEDFIEYCKDSGLTYHKTQ